MQKRSRLTYVLASGSIALGTAISVGTAHAQMALPSIIGSELPGTTLSLGDISIDGQFIDVTNFNGGGFVSDIDGDAIVDAYIIANEPGQPCQTLVYLPSKQGQSAHISSSDLGAYTRIRNYGALRSSTGQIRCPDGSLRLRNFGDLNGDGNNEFGTLYSYNGEVIVDGSVPYGTLIDVLNPIAGSVTLIEDDLEVNPIGDINGDGKTDFSIYSYSDDPDRREECAIVAGQAGSLPRDINLNMVDSSAPLVSLSRNEFDRCPWMQMVGDVNGDGTDDFTIFQGETWVVHGRSSINLRDNYKDVGYQTLRIYRSEDYVRDFDFDADGFSDAIMKVDSDSFHGLFSSVGWLIVYGGPHGLISIDELSSSSDNRFTQVIPKYTLRDRGYRGVSRPNLAGDINGDGATDVLIRNTGVGSGLLGSFLYGTPGHRPPTLIEASIDGSNGINWHEENSFFGDPSAGDFNGDGFDEITYQEFRMAGTAPVKRAADPKLLTVLEGPDSADIAWQEPADSSRLQHYRILYNTHQQVTLPAGTTQYRLSEPSLVAKSALRVQSLDASFEVIGEVQRSAAPIHSELSTELLQFNDVEFNALGDRIDAEPYQLSGLSYGPALGELFWNETKRFVLVWRDGKPIDRLEGNSYMIEEGGEYFLTIDYFGATPDNTFEQVFTSGTLRRSNIVSINTDSDDLPIDPPVTTPIPRDTLPTNLNAGVYSSSTAELFWDRAPVEANIVYYDIDRDGVNMGRSSGTSFLDTTREAGREYTYSVHAIPSAGLATDPATIISNAFQHTYGETPIEEVPRMELLGQVYSSSALELFWPAITGAARYEIFENSVSIFNASARSLFIDSLEKETSYSYRIDALNAAGEIIAQSQQVPLTTRD